MTLAEIENCDAEFLTPAQVEGVLGCDQNALRYQAKMNPELLGFPVIVLKSRVKIPRLGFLHFMKYGKAPIVIQNEEARHAKAL